MPYLKLRANKLFIILHLFGFLTIGNAQTAFEQRQESLGTYLQALHETKNFSGEILIAQDSKIIFHDAIGLASQEFEVPLKIDSKFYIASITKTFTGTLISMAMSEGMIQKEDKAIHYLPSLGQQFKDITISQLLRHTSGLPHNEAIANYWETKSRLTLSSDQMIEEINKLELLAVPGQKFLYSSLGYYILANILEQVYKNDFFDILKNKILGPLNLNNTGNANSLEIVKGMTSEYHLLPNDSLVKAPYRNYSMLKGAGDLYSSAKDLMRWNESFDQEALLAMAYQRDIFNDTNQSSGYGYGWYLGQSERKKYYHGGGTWGYSSYIAYYPETKLSIIALSNVSKLPMTMIGQQLEALVFGEATSTVKTSLESKSTLPTTAYIGRYESITSKLTLDIKVIDGHLYAQLQGNPPFKITPTGGHKFFGKQIDIALNFQVINEKAMGVKATRMGKTFEFKKQ